MEETKGTEELLTIEIDFAELAKCTPDELQQPLLTDLYNYEKVGFIARQGRSQREWAAVDLAKYASFEDFIGACRKVHKGNAVREAIKAEKLGYYGKFFDYASYLPDIVGIDVSAPIRGGNPMTAMYTRTVEERGGYPTRIAAECLPNQAVSWTRRFGLFRRLEGHRQGDVVSDEQLVAYISLRRHGNFANYGAVIGHADHLAEGIMYRMHFELVRTLIAANAAPASADASLSNLKGIRFIGYTDYYGIRDGLHMWKKRGLFEPVYLQCDYLAPAWIEPICRASGYAPENAEWQRQCAEMLTAAAQRCVDEGRLEEAARAQAELAAMSKRLAPESNSVA